MGNCLTQQSSIESATDDEWEDFQAAVVEKKDGNSFAESKINDKKATTEVKIKITKKQLEELVGKVDVKELRVDQVLVQLMEHSRHCHSLHRPWRPNLQSIPELNSDN